MMTEEEVRYLDYKLWLDLFGVAMKGGRLLKIDRYYCG